MCLWSKNTEKKSNMSKQQVVDELHQSARRNFPRRNYVMRGLNDTFQADLIEMIPFSRENRGFNYILMVIDVFSKRAWAKALKNKTGEEVTKAMSSIFHEFPKNIPRNLHTDEGKEFYNQHFQRLMKKYAINHYSTYSKMKASIVERLNRTILTKLWRTFNLQGTHKWVTQLQPIIQQYNSTFHRTIKMRPLDVNKQNQNELLQTAYKRNQTLIHNKRSKFKVNDFVRISKFKSIFEKGYTPNWSTEIFRINKILPTEPVTYRLIDLSDNIIKGCFYSHELLKTQHKDVYLVEKIIRRKGKRLLVKWLGFDDSHSSWIHSDDLV